jgi:hypothetical protein
MHNNILKNDESFTKKYEHSDNTVILLTIISYYNIF